MNFKTLVASIAVLTLLCGGEITTTKANAGYNCRTDSWGNTNCNGSGGSSFNSNTNSYGQTN